MYNYKLILKIITLLLLFLECSTTNNFVEIQQSNLVKLEERLGELKEGAELKLVLLKGQTIKGKYISFENEILFLHEINYTQNEKIIREIPLNQIVTISVLIKKIHGFQIFLGGLLFAVIVSYFLMGQIESM